MVGRTTNKEILRDICSDSPTSNPNPSTKSTEDRPAPQSLSKPLLLHGFIKLKPRCPNWEQDRRGSWHVPGIIYHDGKSTMPKLWSIIQLQAAQVLWPVGIGVTTFNSLRFCEWTLATNLDWLEEESDQAISRCLQLSHRWKLYHLSRTKDPVLQNKMGNRPSL